MLILDGALSQDAVRSVPNTSMGTAPRSSVIMRDPARVDGISDNNVEYYDSAQFFSGDGVGQFHRMETEITPAGGTFFNLKFYIDGKKVVDGDGDYSLDAPSVAWFTRLVGLDPSERNKLTTTIRNWISDAYEQPTVARVELSNNANYDTSAFQTRHYQKTLTRTDNEIQFEVYYGFLDTSSPVYAHVVKSDLSVISERIN